MLPAARSVPRPCSALLKSSLLVLALSAVSATSANAQTYSGGSMNLSDGSVHTSTASVTATGTVTSISVELDGVAATGGPCGTGACFLGLQTTWFILKAPGGQELVLMGATGDGTEVVSGMTVTYTDAASHPTGNSDPPLGGLPWHSVAGYPTVSVKPDSQWNLFGGAPGQTYPDGTAAADSPLSDGTATLAGIFNGVGANGTWTLLAQDDCDVIFAASSTTCSAQDAVSITGWKVALTENSSVSSTTTVLSAGTNPVKSGTNDTITATVSSTGGTPTGTVTFTAGVVDANGNTQTSTLCTALALNGSGQASCSAALSTQGINAINATYTPSGSFGGSSTASPLHVLVEPASASITTSGNQWCNTAQIVVPGSFGSGPPILYPSIIPVTGVSQSVADVTVSLKGVSAALSIFDGMDFLLVGPSGGTYNLDFLSKAFSGSADSGLNLTIEDGAGQTATEATTASSGNWDPSNNGSFVSAPFFPSSTAPTIDSAIPQVPATITLAPPTGAATNTLQHSFSGSVANGDWSLYIMNDNGTGAGDGLTMASGWCVDFTLNTGVATTTTLATSGNPATTGTAVTLTATVKAGGNPVSTGTVTFEDDGATPAGTVSGNNVVTLNGSGQAAFTTSSLSEGDHPITATYNGTADDDVSSSAPLVQRIDDATAVSTVSDNTWQFCNTGAITLPGALPPNNIGPASPNPSNIFVAGLPGTLASLTLALKNFSGPNEQNMYLESLLVGPGNSSGPALDFFSYTGDGASGLADGNFTFEDGQTDVPSAASSESFASGTYAPSSYDSNPDSFFASTSGFYTPPSTFNYAQTHGSATFASTFVPSGDPFDNLNANGTWSLYFNENTHNDNISSPANGWCLNLTETLPSAQASASHSGSGTGGDFVQGEQNANIGVIIANNGPGPTGDPTDTNPMTVTDTLNSAFTYSTYSGTGWSCSAISPHSVTCTNDGAIAQGSNYPTLTIKVNVASNATSPVTNSASAIGAGSPTTVSNTDTITIQPAPVLSVTKSHPGTFNAGQTAEWDISVKNTATGSTTSGTTTVSDALPSGYTVDNFGSTAVTWSCGANTAASITTVTCFSSLGVSGGSSFPQIQVIADVPSNSPASVSNTALAWGGGSLTQTSSGNAASGSDNNVTVVPATVNVTIGTSPAGLSFSIGGVGYSTAQTPALTVGTAYALLTTSPQAGATGVQYVFSQWSDGTLTPADTLTPTASTTSDTAMFTKQYFLTVSAGTGGTIAATTAPNGFYNAGTVQTIAATPSAGYYFVDWTGNVLSDITGATSATATVTMNSPEFINANFAPIPGYVVTTLADDPPGTAANCPVANTPPSANCTLRDAITAADANNGGDGNITFASGLTGTIDLTSVTPTSLPSLSGQISITGPGANVVTVSGNNSATVGSIFTVNTGATVGIGGLTIANGNAGSGQGGGINNSGALTIAGCAFTGNSATGTLSGGGGIFNNQGTLTIAGCAFTGNSATGAPLSGGGGIFNNQGTLTIAGSTFSNNSASFQGGGINSSQGTLTVNKSTFSGNSAGLGGSGGAIFSTGTTLLTVNDSTFSGNQSSGSGGAIFSAAIANVANSIFSGNSATSEGAGVYSSAVFDASYDLYYNNLDGGTTEDDCHGCFQLNPISGNPNLAALGNNGGPTQTMLPLPGSSAICAASSALIPAGITADQRGFGFDSNCSSGSVDVGAVQTNYALNFTAQQPSSVAPGVDMSPAPIVTVTESGTALTAGSAGISVTDSASDLTTTPATGSTSASDGEASFGSLAFTSPTTGDTLTATLILNSSLPAINLTTTSTSFNVTQITPTLSFIPSPGSQTYGTAITSGSLDATATASSATVPGSFAYTTTISSVPNQPVLAGTTILPAGTYTITATFTPASPATYASGSTTAPYSVSPATETVTLGSLTQTYTGSPLSATATTSPVSGVTVTFTYTGISPTIYAMSSAPPTAAGSYTVVGTISNPNYQGTATGALVISPAPETVTLGSLSQTYTGSPLSATATTSPVTGVAVTFTYTGISPTTYSTSSTPPTAAGSYTVVGTISNPNYQGTASGTLTIGKATETVTLGSLSQTYTGSPLSATATTSPVSGLTVLFTYTGISPTTYGPSSTPPTGAGSYTVSATISDPNYQGSASGTLTIGKATETVTLGSLSQTYTGSPLSATATTSPVSGLTVLFTYTGISPTTYGPSSTPPTGAGSYTVSATISNPNYQGSASGTLTIGKATETVTLGSLSQTYTGSPLSATATTSPVSGLTVLFTYTGISPTTYGPSSTPPTGAGSYTVVGTISNPNYQGTASGTLTIISAGAITSPSPGSTLTSASTIFTWNPGFGGTISYGLNIGTSPGGADLLNVYPLSGTSATVVLPTNGQKIYVRLWTVINGTTFLWNDYTYTEFTQSASAIASPAPGNTLTSASTTFTWNPASGGTITYGLNIGTSPGGADLVNVYPLSGTSATVNLPTNGTRIYVRLWTVFNGTTFLWNDYTYTEFSQFASSITSPTSGSTLTSASTTFTWSAGSGGTITHGLNVGTTPGGADLVNIGPLSGTGVTVNLPTNGAKIYVRLWTIFNGTTYAYKDYTYTEFSQFASAITSPSPGSTLTSASTTFTWSAGSGGTITYGLNVGTTLGGADLVNIGPLSGTSVTVTLPTHGAKIYVRLWTIVNGTTYLYKDYTYTEFTH